MKTIILKTHFLLVASSLTFLYPFKLIFFLYATKSSSSRLTFHRACTETGSSLVWSDLEAIISTYLNILDRATFDLLSVTTTSLGVDRGSFMNCRPTSFSSAFQTVCNISSQPETSFVRHYTEAWNCHE